MCKVNFSPGGIEIVRVIHAARDFSRLFEP